MLLSELNVNCDIPFDLEIMQGEQFDYTVLVSDELPLTNKNCEFIAKDSINSNIDFSLTTLNNKITIVGQNILLKFRSETNISRTLLCQFIIIDTITGFVIKSQIGKLVIKPSLNAII